MPKAIDLSQAMNARLCHDLSGIIGAISNYLGLTKNTDISIAQKAKTLLFEESDNLLNKIKFFRHAYGMSNDEISISLISIRIIISDFFRYSKVKLKMSFDEEIISLDIQLAKVMFCLIAIISENIRATELLKLSIHKGKNVIIKLQFNKKKLLLNRANLDILIKPQTNHPIDVYNCREHYINKLCKKEGYKISLLEKSDMMEFSLSKK